MAGYETVIGLECHVELTTRDQDVLRRARTSSAPSRTRTPAPSASATRVAAGPEPRGDRGGSSRSASRSDCEIAPHSLFHRKNYFYPDMPKNYQISQYDLPICVGGHLDVELPDGVDEARRHHARAHGGGHGQDGRTAASPGGSTTRRTRSVDFNRAGVPLVECVSEPDMRSPEEAGRLPARAARDPRGARRVRRPDGGGVAALRRERLAAARPATDALGTKVEIKNMNSIRSLERALAYEIERQTTALDAGEPIVQETRHWDEDAGATRAMRSKEEAFDYRYFPEPDIPALEPDRRVDRGDPRDAAGAARAPAARGTSTELGLKPDVARVLVADRAAATCSRRRVALGADPAAAANWITQDVAALRNAGGDGAAGTAAPRRRPGRGWSPTATVSAAPARSRRSRRRSRPGDPIGEHRGRAGARAGLRRRRARRASPTR